MEFTFDNQVWLIPTEVKNALEGNDTVVVPILDQIRFDTMGKITSRLKSVRSDNSVLVLFDSVGGCMEPGSMLMSLLAQLDVPIVALAVGRVYSMALGIYLSISKENRFALEGSRFLAHRVNGSPMGLNGNIDSQVNEIQDLDYEAMIRRNLIIWNDSLEFERRCREQIIAELGETINLSIPGINGPVSVDEFRNYDIPISAKLAQQMGIVHKIVGELAGKYRT